MSTIGTLLIHPQPTTKARQKRTRGSGRLSSALWGNVVLSWCGLWKRVANVSIYALNLFDLEENDLYLRYSCRSPEAVAKHGGRVVALGRLDDELAGDAEPRSV